MKAKTKEHNIRIIEYPDGGWELGFVLTLKEDRNSGGRFFSWRKGNRKNVLRLLTKEARRGK